MALLSESLVEEWLSRGGFFTIRGIKHGLGELDLLGIRHEAGALVVGWYVEVQSSFRPIGYIARLTKDMARDANRIRTSSATRTPEQIEECALKPLGNPTEFRDR
jgi:hypothetical protein